MHLAGYKHDISSQIISKVNIWLPNKNFKAAKTIYQRLRGKTDSRKIQEEPVNFSFYVTHDLRQVPGRD